MSDRPEMCKPYLWASEGREASLKLMSVELVDSQT